MITIIDFSYNRSSLSKMFLKIKKIPKVNWTSDKPHNLKPKQQKNNVENLGLKLYVLSELQFTFGIFFIFKNIF